MDAGQDVGGWGMTERIFDIDPATVKGSFCLRIREHHEAVGIITVDRYQAALQQKIELRQMQEIFDQIELAQQSQHDADHSLN